MKKPDEIEKGLILCSGEENGPVDNCELGCPYHIDGQILCAITSMMKDALAYIEQLEERIDLMMIQMHGDCGCCKHKNTSAFESPCNECTESLNRDLWEYEGLPELPKEDQK